MVVVAARVGVPYFLVGLPWSSGSLSDSPDWLSRGPAGGAAVAADAAVY